MRQRARTVLRDGSWATQMLERFDPALFDAPAMREIFPIGWDEATARSLDGYIDERILTTLPWGFEVADIGAHVDVWYGEGDAQVPAEHAHVIAELALDSTLFGCPDCRHFVLVARWAEILDRAAHQ